MPKNILVDLNVILDVLLARDGFEASRGVLQLGETGAHTLGISAHVVTTFAYLLESANVPKPQILHHVDWMLRTFRVVTVDHTLLSLALNSRLTDFEDAVIESAALTHGAQFIITRNVKDFKASAIQAYTPTQYLADIQRPTS